MTGDIGDSMIVRFEGKSRVKGNTEKFNRCRSRDNLTVISDGNPFHTFHFSDTFDANKTDSLQQ